MRPLLASAVVATLMLPAIVRADWQFARWGMSKDQVAGAAGIAVDRSAPWMSPDRKIEWAFSVSHQAAGVQFKAQFGFEAASGRLALVKLQPVSSGDCGGLKSALLERYGKPDTENEKKLQGNDLYEARWKDAKAANDVKYTYMFIMRKIVCSIDYGPIGAAGNNGL